MTEEARDIARSVTEYFDHADDDEFEENLTKDIETYANQKAPQRSPGHTIVELQLCMIGNNQWIIDSTSFFIHGYINIQMLEYLISQEEVIEELSKSVDEDGVVKIEVWEDSDDYRTWLDWKPLSKT